MKNSCLVGFFFFMLACGAQASVEYTFDWDTKGLPFEVKTFHAPISMGDRVGEHGPLVDMVNMPVIDLLGKKKLKLEGSESAVLYLVIKNNGKKDIRFSVVPHSIEPVEASLGLDFRCLCFGHIYTVKAGGLWYRIMKLHHTSPATGKSVIALKHKIFEVKTKDQK
ncbi:hypothetical protein D3C87_109650 [compost metagenome]